MKLGSMRPTSASTSTSTIKPNTPIPELFHDVEPIEQDDGPNPVCSIQYSSNFREAMGYLRAMLQKDERSGMSCHVMTYQVMSSLSSSLPRITFLKCFVYILFHVFTPVLLCNVFLLAHVIYYPILSFSTSISFLPIHIYIYI